MSDAIITTVDSGQMCSKSDHLQSCTYEWHLKPGAQLNLIHESWDNLTNINSEITFFLQKGSSLVYVPIITGNAHIKIVIQLEENASVLISGTYAMNGTQKCSIDTRQNHVGKNSNSSLMINGVAAEKSAVSYHGMISIQETAIKSNAQQENKTLLLSDQSTALSVPSLEVHTNDVQCGHGSAIGPLQQEHLVYAQSRGISFKQAQQLLITSYFAQTLDGILDEKVREGIIERLVKIVLKEE